MLWKAGKLLTAAIMLVMLVDSRAGIQLAGKSIRG